jgi:hypothetical protein
MAVLRTLEIISESQGESFYICSDSRSVLVCLNERSLIKKHSILILKIKEKLLALKKCQKDNKFVWIPAHTGIVLNEIADALAKEGIRKGEDAQYLIPGRDLKSHWKTKLRVATEEWYRESGKQKGRKYFEYYQQNNDKPWFHIFRLQRKSIASINRIRSGHHCLKECLIRFNIVNTEMCECGEAKETINHILWQCQLFKESIECKW